MPDATLELERAAADIPLTKSAREILEKASATAASRDESATPSDVLAATVLARGSLADESIRAIGVDPSAIEAALSESRGVDTGSIPLRQLLLNANREAQVLGHYQVDSIHLLLAMLYSDSRATSAALQKAGVTLYELRRHLQGGAVPAAAAPSGALRKRPLPTLRGVLTVSPVFLALIGATVAAGVLLWLDLLPGLVGGLTLLFVTAGWITSLCVHEFGHALVAYLGGDRSVVASGYLTLNPLRYTNLVLSLVLPVIFLLLGGIALPGGAVYVNRSALRSPRWDSAVSVAGPAGTLLCGMLVAVPFLVPGLIRVTTIGQLNFFGALAFLAFIEAFALVINLLPVPGLDGFGILRPWLSFSAQAAAARYGQLGIYAVFIVLWFVPPVSHAFFQAVQLVTDTANIPPQLIGYGQAHMSIR